MNDAERSKWKAQGLLPQKQEGYFVVRLRLAGGAASPRLLRVAAQVADTWGRGEVHLTTRQGLEIPWIAAGDLAAAVSLLDGEGLRRAVCGPRIRGVVACPGRSTCRFGVLDAQALAVLLDSRYTGTEAPHKLKMAVTGCRNNCAKAQENDIGLMGTGGASADSPGLKLWVGGTLGREPELGRQVPGTWTEAGALEAVDRMVAFFQTHGQVKERLGRVIHRTGWDTFLEACQLRTPR